MSAAIYGVLQWCNLTPNEITEVIGKVSNKHIYKGEDFYCEVEKIGKWSSATEEDDAVCIWNSDDAGPIIVDGKEIGLFVHFDENTSKFDWACTYELPSHTI